MKQQLLTATAVNAVTTARSQHLAKTSRSENRYFKRLLILLAIVFSPIFLFAQKTGNIITLSNGSNYLSSTSTNSVTNLTTPTIYSLWEVTVSNSTYSFKNLGTGRYLNGAKNSLSMSTSSSTSWTKDGNYFYVKSGSSSYYIYYNNGWTTSKNGTPTNRAIATTFTVSSALSYTGASTLNYPIAGGTQTITLASFPSVTVNSTIIPLYTVSISGSSQASFSYTINGSTIAVTATTNATGTYPRNATMTISYGNSTYNIVLAQASPNGAEFTHQQGHSGRALLANGMQGVHTERIVMYVPINASTSLIVPEDDYMFSRWYQYDTDADVTAGTFNNPSNYNAVYGNKGIYKTTNSVGTPTFSHSSTATSGIIAEIACDMSNYVDYTIVNTYLLQEPTISERVIFEIHPAAEMAAKLTQHVNNNGATTGSYLEEYEIVAPAGKIVRFGPEYAYSGNTSNYFSAANSRLTSGTWYKNGSQFSASPNNNRVISVTAGTAGTTDTYTLISGGYGIAKFTITYKATSEVGPSSAAIVSESDFTANYKYVTGLRFDGDKNIPLEWDETGYGFYYQDWGRDDTYRSSGHPGVYWAEYTLMNIVPSSDYGFLAQGVRDMKYQNSGATTGNFLYVDAGSTPGVVANLQFKEGGLCPGSRMYVSAWVNNVGKDTDPNLNFSIVGIDGAGEVTVIKTFTTGDLNGTQGTWYQIFFELQMPQVEYADYRLRIENNAQDASGNDFAIDDICVYMQKPALMTYQAGVTCSNQNDDPVVMVRLNPAGLTSITAVDGVQTIYYQFQDADGRAVSFPAYLAASDDYGVATVNSRRDNYDNTTYQPTIEGGVVTRTGLQKYLDSLNNGAAVPQAFYTREMNEKGEWESILYIFHRSDLFTTGSTFSCVIGADPTTFGEDGQCGFSSSFTIQPRAKLILNNNPGGDLTSSGMCANQYNTIRLEMFGAQSGLEEIQAGTCKADWLEGRKEDYVEGGKYEGYDFEAIQDAITALRFAYPTVTSLDNAPVTTGFTAAQKAVLVEIMSRGMLELYQEEIQRRTLTGTSYYTAFPIASSGVDADGNTIEICETPVVICLEAAEGTPSFMVGYNTEIGFPEGFELESRVIRMSEVEANATMLELPVRDLFGITTTQLNGCQVYLLPTTTDTRSTLPIDNGTVANSLYSTVSAAAQTNSQVILSLSGRVAAMDFLPGHRYDFLVVVPLGVDGCQGAGRYSIVVVPDMVMWAPQDNSNSWHVDRNWVMINNQGVVLTEGNGYVPARHTNVLINKCDAIVQLDPIVSATTARSAIALTDDSQTNIEWDLGFEANSCRNIHLGVNAKFVGQHELVYDSAWVDVAVTTKGWNLIAPPFEEMVVGDMYIPSTGDRTNYFEDVVEPDSRSAYQVFTSLYNSSSYQKDRNNDTVTVSSSEWTAPFNALSAPIRTSEGYSVNFMNHVNEDTILVVRFPKVATRYYYYGTYGERTELYEDITRTVNGHRLAGTNDTKQNIVSFSVNDLVNPKKTTHLIANPYLVELDMNKFMSDYYNFASVSGKYYVMDSTRAMTTIDMNNNITTSGVNSTSKFEIEPNTSFMVELAENATSPALRITPSMCTYVHNSSASPAPAYAPSSEPRSVLVVKGLRNGKPSSCAIMMKESANSGFDESDTRMVMMSSDLTPSSVYTNVDNIALAINITSNIHMTPLGYAVLDEEETESLNLTFTGVDEFNGTLSLFDAQTNQSTTLTEGITISLPDLVTSGTRYYICYQSDVASSVDDNIADGNLKLYQPQNGQVVVACSDLMSTIRVYNVNGQLIEERNSLQSSLESFTLSTGVYIFDVQSASGVYREKSVVR